jgi:hypothetical protein
MAESSSVEGPVRFQRVVNTPCLIDQLSIVLAPHHVGAGPRLFDNSVTAEAGWDLTSHTATPTGALCLAHTRTT